MYVVIVGAGKIGISIGRWLIGLDHEIALIERVPEKCAAADEILGSVSIAGDGTEVGVLTKAGVNRADLVVAATDLDEVNLVVCQLAMHRFEVADTVSLVNIPEHERLFDMLGIGSVVNTTDVIVGSIKASLSSDILDRVGETQ